MPQIPSPCKENGKWGREKIHMNVLLIHRHLTPVTCCQFISQVTSSRLIEVFKTHSRVSLYTLKINLPGDGILFQSFKAGWLRGSLSLCVHGSHRCQPSIRALVEPNHPRDELLKNTIRTYMVQCSVEVQIQAVYFLRQLSLSRDAESYPHHMNLWISLHDREWESASSSYGLSRPLKMHAGSWVPPPACRLVNFELHSHHVRPSPVHESRLWSQIRTWGLAKFSSFWRQ